ncbi:hypothetical protein ACOSQ2_030980 [Xanthoceras sorbifolium]
MRTTSPSRTLPPRVRRDFTKETTGIPAMAENNREVRSNLPDKQWSSTAVDVSTGSGLKAGAVEDIMHDPNVSVNQCITLHDTVDVVHGVDPLDFNATTKVNIQTPLSITDVTHQVPPV